MGFTSVYQYISLILLLSGAVAVALEPELLLSLADLAEEEYSTLYVPLPATPSMVRLLFFWNATMADTVPEPYLPSTEPV